MGRRMALALFLALAAAFCIKTVQNYASLVFWPSGPVQGGACKEELARQYDLLSDAARRASELAPERVEQSFLAETEDVAKTPPAACANDLRGIEAAGAIRWARGH